jgi:anti-sigma factor RsiW
MMDYDSQLKVQAYLDGELPEAEARLIAERLGRDEEASALLQELRYTTEALKGSELDVALPESREFFWSKIERQIQREEQPPPAKRPVSLLARLQSYLVPASAVALLTIVLTLSTGRSVATPPGEMELVSDEMAALTFRSQAEGMTMVWLYPRTDTQVASEASPIDFDTQ